MADGFTAAAGLLGQRWTLLIIGTMLTGPRRFTDLARTLPGISPSTLTKRLRALEQAGLAHQALTGSTVAYHLTCSGQELGEIIVALDRWGSRRLSEQSADICGPSTGDAAIPGARGEPTQETP